MERGGGSGKSTRISVKIPQSSSEKRDGFCRTVCSNGVMRDFQKKRSRVVVSSDSESSDDEEPPRRGDRAEFVWRKKEVPGGLGLMKMDVFEFDEYDGFDSANLMRKRFDNGRSSFAAARRVGGSLGGSSSGRDGVLFRRKRPYMSSQEGSSSETDSEEPIRVQGRNGVLKVKVNNKTSSLAVPISHREGEIRERPPSYLKEQKRGSLVVKPSVRKSYNVYSESEESDEPRKPKKRKSEYTKSKKEMNTKSKLTSSATGKPAMTERGRRNGGTEKQKLRERIKGMLIDAGWTVDYRPRRNQSYLDAVYVNPSGVAYWSIIKAHDALLKQLKDEEIDARSRKDAVAVTEELVNNLARKAKTRAEMTKKWKNDSRGLDSEKESDEDDEGGADTGNPEERRIGSSVKLGGKSTKRRSEIDWGELNSSKGKRIRPLSGSDSHHLHGRKSKKIGRCTLLVRSSKDKKNPAVDGFNPYSGKRTLLSWLIDSGVVHLRQKVQYMNQRGTDVMLEGLITREGIHCDCCSKILTVSRFEIHAGSKSCQPFQNIYLESGASLLQCQVRAWNMQKKDAKNLGFHHVGTDGDDPNDDACGICGDGGDLICCDGCPSTYHQTCLGMQVLPPGDWHCPNCTCKYCDAAKASGCKDGNVLPLLSCNMCERRYHQSCLSELEAHKVQSLESVSSYCGLKCLELFEKLQKYLGVKNELESGYTWSLIRRLDTDSDSKSQQSAERIVNNSKLAVGLAIMDECFLPIIDRRTGVNIIGNVLYNCGSNFNRINYTGFYTAILERGDEIICAASLRFHGIQLAEMPFIGTRHIYRRQGMCRRLFNAIESAMRSLKVEKLVIPAIPDFLHAWTGNFGFSPLDESVRKEMRSLNALVFPGIDMLQKPLLHEKDVIATAATGDYVVAREDALISEIATEKKSEFACSAENAPLSNEIVAEAGSCYKKLLVSDEDKTLVSVETVMDTLSTPEDELRRSLSGEKCGVKSSCQITLKSCTKDLSGHPCEDKGSSCEDGPTDVTSESVACLNSQEIQQASAIHPVENSLSSSISGRGSSDLSSLSQKVKSEQNSSNEDNIELGAKLAESKESKDNSFTDGFLL